jgi:hypothetical protein
MLYFELGESIGVQISESGIGRKTRLESCSMAGDEFGPADGRRHAGQISTVVPDSVDG